MSGLSHGSSAPTRNRLEDTQTIRTRLFESRLAAVDNLCAGAGRRTRAQGFSPDFQVCFPYSGLFVWRVGGEDVVGDANQVLFVSGGEAYEVSEPTRDGYGELIVTPAVPLLSELMRMPDTRLSSHPLFAKRSHRANASTQTLRARFLHRAANGDGDRDLLAAEELLIDLLRCALAADTQRLAPPGATRRLIRRTKLFLEAHSAGPVRLGEVARAVGASPAYLTDVFRRFEGIPLHKYLVQLRLAKALIELPHANDLTELALGRGFSSHSHFAAAFRRAFGCTPSAFRESTRSAQRRCAV